MDKKTTIFIADNEQSLLDLLSSFLEREGFFVQTFSTGDALLAACENEPPDLVVLDVVMPGTDGLSICSSLKQRNADLPVIMISERTDPYDRLTGLLLGCDDYIIKPFLPLELSIRIRSLLSRKNSSDDTREEIVLRFGPLELFPGQRVAKLDGKPFSLSPTEFDFLAFLIERNGNAVSREELLNTLWHVNWQANTRVTDDLVKRLRRKFRAAHSTIRIETVWGYGFRISVGERE